MLKISRFSLARHSVSYETWPYKTRLIHDGVMLDIAVPGHTLIRQFETEAGYLLVTALDFPHKEAIGFTLIDKNRTTVLSSRQIEASHEENWPGDIVWRDPWHFDAFIAHSGLLASFTIRRFHIPEYYPQLGLTLRRVKADFF